MFRSLTLLLALVNAPLQPAADQPRGGRSEVGQKEGQAQRSDPPEGAMVLLGVQEVWAQAPHNAFTDLIRQGDSLILAFREGRGHVSADGSLRILRSEDGRSWSSCARLVLEGYDLRDADLSLTPEGGLLLIGGACPRAADGERAPTGTIAARSKDGVECSAPALVVDPGRWLWRVAWAGERAFGVSYSAGSGAARLDLLTSTDASHWTLLRRDLHPERPSNETALAFAPSLDFERDGDSVEPSQGDPLLVALARAQEPGVHASVGVARAPYEHFRWRSLDFPLGGPNLIRTPGGAFVAAGRVMRNGQAHTAVFLLDPTTGATGPLLWLPSGGDTSYPGLAWRGDELFVSYYSSHGSDADPSGDSLKDARSRIFVARLRVTE